MILKDAFHILKVPQKSSDILVRILRIFGRNREDLCKSLSIFNDQRSVQLNLTCHFVNVHMLITHGIMRSDDTQ